MDKTNQILKAIMVDNLPEDQKIRALEDYIKTRFTIKQGGNPEYEDLASLVSNRVGNQRGIFKLYIACLLRLDINFQVVFAGNRDDGAIDRDFPTPLDISDALIYFPVFDKYVVPSSTFLRMGGPPDEVAETDGLFVTCENTHNHFAFVNYTFKPIEPVNFDANKKGVHATLQIKDGLAQVTQENFWQGATGELYRGIYSQATDDQRQQFMKLITTSGIDDAKVLSRTVEGEDIKLSDDPANYFRIHTTYTAPSLVQTAGNDYLVAIGKLIGTQAELYQEEERQTDISFDGTEDYLHELTLEIPVGYTCSGYEDSRVRNELVEKGGKDPIMFFVSDYKIEGNKLTISINEVYKKLRVSRDAYSDFRKVVNSAANFNKLVLVLSPEVK